VAALIYRISYQLIDCNKAPASFELLANVSSGLAADAQLVADSFAATLDAATESQITKITIAIAEHNVPSGLKSAPTATYDNMTVANFSFSTPVAGQKYTKTVPNFLRAGFLASDTAIVDQTGTNAPVDDFIAAMTTGGIDAKAVAVDDDGNILDAVTKAIKSGRSERRQLAKRR